jgi:DNA-binding transcriptional regulator LsrR (DeoR family)
MVLTREEKEGLVTDLYNQGKNTRQIAQQVGISFRDIGAILQNAAKEKEREHSISVSSQAYAMFSECKTPIQVAIKLNLREAEVTKFYTEFWNLNDLEALSKVYHEINGNNIFWNYID